MTVERMTRMHARGVASLHMASLGGLLTRLGHTAVRAYYEASARSPHSTAFVALERERVVGFVSGAQSPRALRSDVVRRNPLGFGVGALIGGLRNPSNLIALFRSAIDSPAYDADASELTYLAVDASQRGRGTGKALVQAFSNAMRTSGRSRYELSVAEANADAQRFYERIGFKRIGSYEEFGATQLRYALQLQDATA